MDATTLTVLAAGISWIAKKVVKENFTTDPSSKIMNYAKFTTIMTGSVALKQYLNDLRILPTNPKKNVEINGQHCNDDHWSGS